MSVYLDYAAATPLDSEVLAVMMPYFADYYHNPSAIYMQARRSKYALDEARAKAAKILGVQPGTIIFTGSGTESDNLAISGVMKAFPDGRLLVSAIEHDAVLEPAKEYAVDYISVDERGIARLDDMASKITDETVLVSVMYANNEIGTIQPLKEISALLEQVRRDRQKRGVKQPLYFHTDACQAANYLDLHVSKLGVDLMTLNSSKVYGPKGVGLLYVAPHVRLKPVIDGGGQEYGLRSGTENLALIAGFAAALEKTVQIRHEEAKRLHQIQDYFFETFKDHSVIVINGHKNTRLPNNIHITVKGADNERLVFELDEAGFEVATGSACSASSDEPSHVLKAIGLSDIDAQSSIRITMGRQTTLDQIEGLAAFLSSYIA